MKFYTIRNETEYQQCLELIEKLRYSQREKDKLRLDLIIEKVEDYEHKMKEETNGMD